MAEEAMEKNVNPMPGETAAESGGSGGIDWNAVLADFEGERESPPEGGEEMEAPSEEAEGETSEDEQDEEGEGEEEAEGEDEASSESSAEDESAEADAAEESYETKLTPEKIEEKLAEERKKLVAELEKRFAISEEEAEELIAEPQKVLPRFKAQLMVELYENLLRAVHTTVPAIVDSVQQYRSQADQYERAFFERWPELKDEKYQDALLRMATAYRQANPDASPEDFIEEVGAQAMVRFKITPKGGAEGEKLPEGKRKMRDAEKTPPSRPRGGAKPGQVKRTQVEEFFEEITALDEEE